MEKKKSIWPYKETYKGYELEIFKYGSVVVVKDCRPFVDLTEAFAYIDKKEKMNTVTVCGASTGTQWSLNNFSLAPFNEPQVCNTVPCQKGNNPMYVDNDKHIESSKINYLTSRGEHSFYQKVDSLTKVFGFGPYDAPETVEDMVARFTAGKFTFKEESKKNVKGFYYRLMDGITWKDPSVKEDQAGYDAAKAALTALWQDTKDTIAIGTPVEGLAAVKALDAWTPTVGNT